VKFMEISLSPDVDFGTSMKLLDNAANCTVLAPAGPQRSRLLASLIKDERISNVPNYEILKKMFLERIITPAEMMAFSGLSAFGDVCNALQC